MIVVIGGGGVSYEREGSGGGGGGVTCVKFVFEFDCVVGNRTRGIVGNPVFIDYI